jgi:cyanate permease
VEVQRRLKDDRSWLADEFDLKYLFQALKDWKIYVHMFITIGIYTPLYSIALFLPTIVKNMGYSNERAQLMTVPPYVIACVFTIGAGYAADKAHQRGVFMMGFELLAIAGFTMLISSGKPAVQYTGTFLAASGKSLLFVLQACVERDNVANSWLQ